ncbi:hypothetical protein [uncultured Williamsia sp.]|uniref:hypothetical protein n=1 Tax=uncultured Williamsia sp. TaxID=259311 RepID=UPI0026068789|nr:hypothetical protein [uncultured Williamsia sp.]
MMILGIIAIVVGAIVGVPWIWIVGIVLTVAGATLAASGRNGRLNAGRAHYF